MRDIPDIYRYAAIAILVLSLLFTLKGLGGGPSGVGSGSVGSAPDNAGKTVVPEMILYPSVPEKMPNLNDGYVFNQERQFEEEDLTAAGSRGVGLGGTIDLNEVIYSGSLIVGDIRRALISYQEAAPAPARVKNRRTRTPARKSSVKKTYRHKQLDPGEDFMGYKVAKIESDRIVFERGSEKIEKFLYDGSKDRVVVKSAAPKTSAATKGVVPPTTGRRSSPPAARTATPAKPRAATSPVKTRNNTGKTLPAPATRRSRRSQRFLGLDPSVLATPPTPTSPQNQAEPR
ncbi:MAG: hypothetical protein ABFQ82_01290 [Thermodesulfobacteriota bacterium]